MQNTIKGDRFGVEAGAVVRLIGPARTYKSDLALGFLRYTFAQPFRTLLALLETLSSKGGARVLPRYPQGPEITQLARYREVMRTDFFIGHYSKTSRLGVKELRVRIAKGLAQSPPKHAKLSSRNKEFFDANLTSQIGDRASEISLNILAILSDPSMMRVGILFTARFHEFDVLVESFAKRLCDHYQEYVSVLDRSELLRNRLKLPPAVPVAVLCELILKALIRKGLLYRRVSLNELTPSLVFHSLRRYLQVARKAIEPLRTKVEESKAKLNRDLSFHEPPSWQMRLVIDDLSAFRLPGGEDFDAFQSLLASYLRRNGVTTLLVESVSSEPGVLPVAVNRKSTMDRSPTIRTMRLRFAHGERVAITVEPPLNDDYYGILRELRLMQSNHGMVPIVDPNLELYSNLQEGRPKLVPLEVRLFNETIGCKRYLEETDKFLVEFLGGRDSEAEQLLVSAKGISLSDYDVLKDLCATPQLATLTKTLVVQVDGFWNLRPGGDLRNMKDYLTRSLLLKSQKSSDLEDQFSMFKPSLANSEIDNSGLNEQHVGAARLEYFQIPFRARSGAAPTYATRLSRSHPGMDRVPYTWDFGFLLCRRDLWYRQISRSQSGSHGDSPSQLLERLRIGSPARTSNQRGKQQPHVSWFDFLRVAEMVARSSAEATGSVVPILDLGEESPNSIDSLVLEIWFSEILAELTNPGGAKTGPTRHEFLKTVAGDLRHGMAEPNGSSKAPVLAGGLLSLLSPWGRSSQNVRIHEEPDRAQTFQRALSQIGGSKSGLGAARFKKEMEGVGFTCALYRTWLLLSESIAVPGSIGSAVGNHCNVPGGVSARAIATRHWYKTACAETNASLSNTPHSVSTDLIPCRLPGNFSVRGDWYLGILRSSSSARLGEHAIDLLSGIESVRRRLEYGVGLPVRELSVASGESSGGQLTTGMVVDLGHGPQPFPLDDLLQLGAASGYSGRGNSKGSDPFFWCWRSNIDFYDQQSAVFKRWLQDLVKWTVRSKASHGLTWISGLELYSDIKQGKFDRIAECATFVEFAGKCDALAANLRAVTHLD